MIVASPRLWPYLLVSAVCGVLVTLSGLHRFHNADSLLPILVSVQHWTFFFWGQDRYGMFVPLLATPFSHPLTNLLVQTGISAASGFAGVYLTAAYLFRDRTWPVVGSTALIVLVAAAPERFLWMYLSTWMPSAPSLALGLGSLLLLLPACEARWPSSRRCVAAVVCIILASWLNAAIGLFLLPLALATGAVRWWCDRSSRARQRREVLVASAVCGLGILSAILAQSFSEFHGTVLTIAPPADHWARMIKAPNEFWTDVEPRLWLGVLAGCVLLSFLLALAVPSARRDVAGSLAMVAAVGVAGFALAFVMAAVSMGYWRYSLPTIAVLHVAIVGAAVRPLVSAKSHRTIAIVLAALAVIAIPVTLGAPSIARVRSDLRTLEGRPEGVPLPPNYHHRFVPVTVGERADAVVAARCTHVAGPFWDTGPVVFLANVILADRGEDRTVWGIALRPQATIEKWRAVPMEQVRVGLFPPGSIMDASREFPGLEPAGTVGPLEVYVPR